MSEAKPLSGKVALITGASRGIGLAIAQCLAKENVSLMLNGRSLKTLATVQSDLQTMYPGLQIETFAGSISDYDTVKNLVDETIRRFRHLDIVINNAGFGPKFGLLQETTVSDLDACIDINLKAPLYVMHTAIPYLVNQGTGGTIININSIAGKKAYPYSAVYCASKFGLTGLTESIAQEQRPNGIKVISIHPGEVLTEMWNDLEPGIKQNPNKMLTPQDIAQSVRYALLQPDNAVVSDITILPQYPVNH